MGAAGVVRLNAQPREEVMVTKQPVSNRCRSQLYTGMPDVVRLTLLMDTIGKLEAKVPRYEEASSTLLSILSRVSYFWLQEPSALRVSPSAPALLAM